MTKVEREALVAVCDILARHLVQKEPDAMSEGDYEQLRSYAKQVHWEQGKPRPQPAVRTRPKGADDGSA